MIVFTLVLIYVWEKGMQSTSIKFNKTQSLNLNNHKEFCVFDNYSEELEKYSAIRIEFGVFPYHQGTRDFYRNLYVNFSKRIILNNLRYGYVLRVGDTKLKTRIKSYKGFFPYKETIKTHHNYIEKEFDTSEHYSFFIGLASVKRKNTNKTSMQEIRHNAFSLFGMDCCLLVAENPIDIPAYNLADLYNVIIQDGTNNKINYSKAIRCLCSGKSWIIRTFGMGEPYTLCAYTEKSNFNSLASYLIGVGNSIETSENSPFKK